MHDPLSSAGVFDSALGDRTAWWSTALALREAAERLYATLPPEDTRPAANWVLGEGWVLVTPQTSVVNVCVLLVALSLENLLKGEIVRIGGHVVRGGRLGPELKSHDLFVLADRAHLADLSHEETRLLKTGTEATVSWGRYPGGVSHEQGSIGPPEDLDLAQLFGTFASLFDRLQSSVMQGIDDSWADDVDSLP